MSLQTVGLVGIRKGNYFEFRINQTIMTVPAVRSFSVAVPEGLFLLLRICSLSSCNIVRVILYHLLLKFFVILVRFQSWHGILGRQVLVLHMKGN